MSVSKQFGSCCTSIETFYTWKLCQEFFWQAWWNHFLQLVHSAAIPVYRLSNSFTWLLWLHPILLTQTQWISPVSSNRIKLFRITGNCFAFPVVGDSSNLDIRVYLYFMSPAFLGATVYFQKVNIDYIVKTWSDFLLWNVLYFFSLVQRAGILPAAEPLAD